jgi:7-carboxy-7-deazaguanine synthase
LDDVAAVDRVERGIQERLALSRAMRIAEIYSSRQGEGLLTGTPSVFVRASGCNLRCRFCDTPFTSWAPEGEDYSVSEIVARTRSFEVEHVVITGGEPMLFAEMIPLTEQLQHLDKHITIETAGTLTLPVQCDLMSISPKLSNSTPDGALAGSWSVRHERDRYRPEVIRDLVERYEHQIKFVVAAPEDLLEIREYLAKFPDIEADRVLLMPEGVDPARLASIQKWLEPKCAELGFRFCPRKHIEWYGNKRGV